MQKLTKIIFNNARIYGLNTNTIVYRFGRAGSKRKMTFAEIQKQQRELQEPEDVESLKKFDKKVFIAPEDFGSVQESESASDLENEGEDLENHQALFRATQQEVVEPEDQFRTLDPETKRFIKDELIYPGYDPHPEKLVQRPYKDAVWGLGGQLLRRKTKFFEKGKMPEIEEIIVFLETEHAKDVVLIDLHEIGRTDLPQWGIILTGYSSRHMYRMATSLVKSVKELEVPEMVNPPAVHGRRDDDWIMVSIKNVMIHMFTEESREDIDIEAKWRAGDETDDEEAELDRIEKDSKRHKLYQTYKGEL